MEHPRCRSTSRSHGTALQGGRAASYCCQCGQERGGATCDPRATSGSAIATTAFKSKRGRVTKPRSGAYLLLGRYQVDRLLKIKQSNAVKAAKKAAEAEAKEAIAAAEADANHRLRSSLQRKFVFELGEKWRVVLGRRSCNVRAGASPRSSAQWRRSAAVGLRIHRRGHGKVYLLHFPLPPRHGAVLGKRLRNDFPCGVGVGHWLTAIASFLESVPLELDAMLLTEPIASFLPFRIRQGLIETYSLHLDDLEHHYDEQERVMQGEELPPQLEAQLIEQQLHTAPGPAVVALCLPRPKFV
ncbi:EGF-like, conserved site [Phytophthora cactorum]|nr:EGF-like, conserved site [Phytophthora cactorum]